jgi:hypothetical protein
MIATLRDEDLTLSLPVDAAERFLPSGSRLNRCARNSATSTAVRSSSRAGDEQEGVAIPGD